MNKHFIKTVLLFTGMIIVGLLGVFLLSYFDKSDEPALLPGNVKINK
jgi:hypothetical protein